MAHRSHERRPPALVQPRLAEWLLPLIALLMVVGLSIALIAGLGQDHGNAGDPPAVPTAVPTSPGPARP